MNIQKHVLDELYYLQFQMPDYVLDIVKREVDELKNSQFEGAHPYNYSLAGAIEHEYVLFKSAEVINHFFSHDRFFIKGKRLKLAYSSTPSGKKIPSLWVNFQKKHEFNPIHNHDGDASFVLWLNIPYNLKDETSLPHARSGTAPTAPSFIFLYSPIFSNPRAHVDHYHIEVDKTYEGKCIIFPSSLQHMVTPFYTSDDYRISVSGNFFMEND